MHDSRGRMSKLVSKASPIFKAAKKTLQDTLVIISAFDLKAFAEEEMLHPKTSKAWVRRVRTKRAARCPLRSLMRN